MDKLTSTGAPSDFVVEVTPRVPERLARLPELADDLYFSWNRNVRRLFAHIDGDIWDGCYHNPKVFLRRVRQHRLDFAARDPILLAEYRRVLSEYDTYMQEPPHTDITPFLDREQDLVAYFSAEFGFHESIPIYAGGLGILAGDYCKAMSNLWVPFVGVGLLYKQGYFRQKIVCGGEQVAHYPNIRPEDIPIHPVQDKSGDPLLVQIDIEGREVSLRIWEMRAGHIRIYLLDSDLAENAPGDRSITAQLYGGDQELRIRQEIALGIGGVRALRSMGLVPTVWHINEGHAAFLILERCLECVYYGVEFDAALERIAASTVFTTHTPVPAGHDVFHNDRMRAYFRPLIAELGIDERRFLELGANPRHSDGFCMTSLAMRGSRFRNGVSRIHGRVAAEMESYVWPDIAPEENPVGYITNGVDVDTFLGLPWVFLFEMYVGGGWRAKLTDQDFWCSFIDSIPDHVYQSVRHILQAELLERAGQWARDQYGREGCTETMLESICRYLNRQSIGTLVIGFARRFATYKRATLLFDDLERLARLLNDPERPVLILFAGKAHPNDEAGQALLRQVYEVSMRPEFMGRIVLLENYNISMARELLAGVDLWLNVPEYPKEACGTSGMKAAINGAVNLSVLDGWWDEAWDGDNGWAVRPRVGLDSEARREREASELLDILEQQVIPAYFEGGHAGDSPTWIARSKASMKSILPRFNAIRMAMDYLERAYGPAAKQGHGVCLREAAGARTLAAWKQRVASAWPRVRGRIVQPIPDRVSAGQTMDVQVAVHLDGLEPGDVVVECLAGGPADGQAFASSWAVQLQPDGTTAAGETLYRALIQADAAPATQSGLQHYRLRIYPYHALLGHRFECGLALWL